ncbi:MAG: DUF58 domain-containing protein [Spirochaetia bacterium]|jgi:uncharacterized protein (DUF58 family)
MTGSGPRAGGIALFLLFLLVFLFAPITTIRILALFFVLVQGLSLVMGYLLPRSLSIRRGASIIRVNRFQRITVMVEVRNRWPLPVRSVLVTDGPGGIFPVEPPVFLLSLAPRERKTLTWEAETRDRGEFIIGPLTLSGPGPFGLHPWKVTQYTPLTVIVYPAVFPLTLEHKRGLPAGNIAVLNRLYEDVSRFRSLREYAPGDELRRISWKVSARLGKLYSMEYLPSLYFPVLVLLNLSAPDYPLHARHAQMERAIELAASLAVYFIGLKQEVGLAATATISGEEGCITVPIRAGSAHGVKMLEALARARASDEQSDFLRLAQGAASSGGVAARTGTRILAVTPPLSRERRAALRSLSRKGLQVEAFFITSQDARPEDASLPGIVSHAVDGSGGRNLHV